jgi:DNA mismatch repair protein MutL
MRQYRDGDKMTQQLLAPLVVEAPFSVTNDTKDRVEIINGLGYEVEEFGPKSFNIRGIPAFLSISEAECFLLDIMETLPESGMAGNDKALSRVITRACKSAVKGGDRLDTTEIRALLADLNRCENPFSCPHGRPVFVRLRKRDIERLFKRV